MSHAPGTTIGPYTVEREIGRGGMGVVLLATDTRLHRQVALKALPPDLAGDPERLSRFEREARVLASLTHANVAGIHAVEHDEEGRQYLVLEYVPGETLGETLARGPLPVDEALHVASQIASGVGAAHDAGIVHRDLKPANIKLTPDGHVKVLDFGIAKALAPDLPTTVTASPTLTMPQTQPGAVMGTAPYMSPEQARGKPIDKRTDVWAFACVLYECLTGDRAFPGETAADVLGAIIERDPDWNALPANTPYRVRDLLARCLAKDRNKRLRDIGDARLELDLARENREWSTTSLAGQPVFAPKRRVPWAMVALLAIAAGVILLQFLAGRSAPAPAERARPVRFSIDPFDGVAPPGAPRHASSSVKIAPDGSAIAYYADPGDGSDWGIYVRRLDEFEARRIPGTTNAGYPFFSPDGQWLGYVSREGSIMKVSLRGGPAQTLCHKAWSIGSELLWRENGTIVCTMRSNNSIGWLPETGGEIQTLLRTDAAAGIKGFERIALLPDDRGLLFSAWDGSTIESFNIFVLEDGQTSARLLLEHAAHPEVLDSGSLVFLRDDTLLGVALDLETLTLRGAPAPIIDSVETDVWAGTAFYDVSRDGVAIYTPGRRRGADRHLAFVDPETGAVERITLRPDAFFACLSASPDGRHLTIGTIRRRFEFWLYDLERHALSAIPNIAEVHTVAWAPDGSFLTYAGFDPQVNYDDVVAFTRSLGSSESSPLSIPVDGAWWPRCWTADGKLLVTITDTERSASKSAVYDPASGAIEPLADAPDTYVYETELSNDGRWLAYCQYRDPEAREHVWVRRYPDDGRAWQISFEDVDGQPHWSPDGTKLYFANQQTMYVVDIETEPEFRASPARPAFEWPFPDSAADWDDFDMHPSGKFVTIERADWERDPVRYNVVLGFDGVVREALEEGE